MNSSIARPRTDLFHKIKRFRIAYLFIAPALLFMLVVHIIPTIQAIYMSFLNLNTRTLLQYLNAPWVGLEHYKSIILGLTTNTGDSLIKGLGQALNNSFWFTIFTQGGTLLISLVLALLLNRNFRGRGVARTMVLLPWVVPTFAVGIIFQFIWMQQGGLANRILYDWFHIINQPITWLIGPNSRIALIIPAIWNGLPFQTIMLLSSLQIVPLDLYEAASIDGANTWQKFSSITFNYLKPVIFTTTMFGVIFNFFGFGPYNIAVSLFSSDNLGKYNNLLTIAIVRQTFNNQLFGYGAAASVLVMLAAFVFVGIWYALFRKSLISE